MQYLQSVVVEQKWGREKEGNVEQTTPPYRVLQRADVPQEYRDSAWLDWQLNAYGQDYLDPHDVLTPFFHCYAYRRSL